MDALHLDDVAGGDPAVAGGAVTGSAGLHHLSPGLARAFGGQVSMSDSDPTSAVHALTGGERRRLRFAAARAHSVYPGPVGELISRELVGWEQFGYRVGGTRFITGLIDSVERADRERGERRRAGHVD